MKLLHATLLACAGLFCASMRVGADDIPGAPKPDVATLTSPIYPQVSCSTTDPVACAEAVQLAADTRDALTPLIQLNHMWRFPVHIRIVTPDDPLADKIKSETSAVLGNGDTMRIEAALLSNDPNAREFIQRQFVTAMLWEKFFAKTKTFDDKTRLDVVPMWIVEGLREWVNDDPDHNRERIVQRAVDNKRAPTLQTVVNWTQMSEDRLMGLWQRAFCYYLVESLVKTDDRRQDFQQWLSGFTGTGANDSTAELHFPTEEAWQRELLDASNRSRTLVFSWSETERELIADETITYATSKEANIKTCTVDTVINEPRSQALVEALHERVLLLTQLELRAHPGWHEILEAYRVALTALATNNDPAQAKDLLEKAHKLQVAESDYHQKLLDYTNWFEVTNDYGERTHFQSYFSTAQEMERVEADPAHPNPIRASLLKIESKL